MSGKSYSTRELKTIVDYLVQHNAYGETKGRKMWMDFANSRLTDRTWQSLKEVFLKRILPDISNPYYKLDVNQILSFKRGMNLTESDKNKLEFQPVGEKSDNNEAKGDNEQPSTRNNNEENATGEDTSCSKVVHNRASTETLILENCYETAEDIQRDLERSTDEEEDNEKRNPETKSAVKSVRDFIVYSEPLTPMLQEVLDDFATDEESSDRMLIDENYVASESKSKSPEKAVVSPSILNPKVAADKVETTRASEKDSKEKPNHDSQEKVTENQEESAKTMEKLVSENHEKSSKSTEADSLSQFEDVMVLVDKALAKHLGNDLSAQSVESQEKAQSSHEASSVMTDTLLPNNQEAVNSSTFRNKSPLLPTPQVNGDQATKNKRKRSQSIEVIETNKTKKLKDTAQPISNESKHSDAVDSIGINGTTKQTDAEQSVSNLNNEKGQDKTDGLVALELEHDRNKAESIKKKPNLTLNNKRSNTKANEEKEPIPNETVTHDHDINSDSSEVTVNPSTSQLANPCLKSVNLYAEQFTSKKYSDSDVNIVDDDAKEQNTKKDPKPKSPQTIPVADKADDVILLKSRSNSESDEDSLKIRVRPNRTALKQRQDRIARVFGFTNGGGGKTRRMNGRKRTTSHRSPQYFSSDSSEWTSASDSEFVSPPRGRRNRYTRKYLKPRSTRIMSLEEEGGLFVMLGKKIYPLVKDGKNVKNYLTYLSESDPEADDSFWKNKYVEERKRTAELKKMLQKSKQQQQEVQIIEDKESAVEISSPPPPPLQDQKRQSVSRESVHGNELATRNETPGVSPQQDKMLKIKFTKNDQEIQLEGHWQNINPVLAQVVSMLQKEPAMIKQSESVTCVELSSRSTTPRPLTSDTGVKEKVNKMESAIFKEIVEQHEEDVQPTDKEENGNISENTVQKDTNVTLRKRRGRPAKKDVLPTTSPARSARSSVESKTKLNNIEETEPGISDSASSVATNKRTRTPRKTGVAANNSAKKVNTRISTSAKETENEDEEVFYMFPSPPPVKRGRKSKASLTDNPIETAKKHSKSHVTSPDCLSNNSINSNQGYQDSDTSPFHVGVRKKRRFSVSTLSLRGRKTQRRPRSKSFPHLVDYETSESSNSSFSISVKSVTQSTVNSEEHRSESYQLLMPRTRKIMQKLEKIQEATTSEGNRKNVTNRTISNVSVEIEISEDRIQTTNNDVASSSNLSFPPSPELSIVENLSIEKSALLAHENYLTMNETNRETAARKSTDNKYLMSEVDVSMPLMAQECSLRKHLMSVLNDISDLKHAPKSAGRNLPEPDKSSNKMSITESVLNEICSMNIENSLSDSLDRRLEQLLLESAQKSTAIQNQGKMDVDTQVKKIPKSRKRSSTPNKKKAIQKKAKGPEISIVEEECRAQCAHAGRRSCPPSINIVYYEDNVPDNLEINIHDQSTLDVATVTKRKSIKKDIIKVKILRPKKKPEQKRKSLKTRTSENNECDNESGVFLQSLNDTADLIHNHSETCLHIKDCMKDSVEFIETTSQSIISLNSSASCKESKENLDININIIEDGKLTPQLFCEDAQCAVNLEEAKSTKAGTAGSDNTEFFTPLSRNNSILTEDLSDESPIVKPPKSRPTKWYLLSDEETTNTNYFDAYQDEANDVPSYGAGGNLQQLFPITCAVPDLSTITEMSERYDNSPKTGVESRGDTEYNFQSNN